MGPPFQVVPERIKARYSVRVQGSTRTCVHTHTRRCWPIVGTCNRRNRREHAARYRVAKLILVGTWVKLTFFSTPIAA
jgi:hypothetical protein